MHLWYFIEFVIPFPCDDRSMDNTIQDEGGFKKQ